MSGSRDEHADLGPPVVTEVAEGIFAYIRPDGSWWINNTVTTPTATASYRIRLTAAVDAGITPLQAAQDLERPEGPSTFQPPLRCLA